MAQRDQQKDPDEWRRILQWLLQETQSLRRALARKEERLDQIEQFLVDKIQGFGNATNGHIEAPPLPPARRCGPRNGKFLLEIAAQHGVEHLKIEHDAQGKAFARVEGGRLVALPPILKHLLSKLAEDTGRADGDLVGWKSLSDIQVYLEAQTGRVFKKHSIEQHISRLRKALESEGGVNPRYVMTHPEFGWRFALRRKSRF